MSPSRQQRLVHQPVAPPLLLRVKRFGQRDSLADKAPEGISLRKRLPVELVNPLRRAVGRNHHQRHMLIESLSNGRGKVEQRRPTGDADGNRFAQTLCHSQRIETCRAFIRNGIALDIRALVEIMHYRRIAASRTAHRILHAVSHKQCRQCVHIIFITISHSMIKL